MINAAHVQKLLNIQIKTVKSNLTYLSTTGALLLLLVHQNASVRRTLWSLEATRRDFLNSNVLVGERFHSLRMPRGHLKKSNPDFGGLELQFSPDFERKIDPDNVHRYNREREIEMEAMSQDEWNLISNWLTLEDVVGEPECQGPSYRSLQFSTCNTIHEYTSHISEAKMLGKGISRMGWLFTPEHDPEHDFVLKQIRLNGQDYDHKYKDERILLKNQRETLILERLSASKRVVDIYGACGTSNLVEAMAETITPTIENRDSAYQLPSSLEKIDMAISVAEAIAEMHGFEGGPIFNADLSASQFLIAKDGKTVKLNDFNSAYIPGWNGRENRYCKIERGPWRNAKYPPEAQLGFDLDEGMDVYTMGDFLATILTGMPVLTDQPMTTPDKYHMIQKHRANPDFLKPSDIIMDSMVQLMEAAWAFEPVDRPDIFEILRKLRETKEQYKQQTVLGRMKDVLSHSTTAVLWDEAVVLPNRIA